MRRQMGGRAPEFRNEIREWLRVIENRNVLFFRAVREELAEHVSFVVWALRRIVLPLAFLFFLLGLFTGVNVLGSLTISLFVFLYSSILPDMDMILRTAGPAKRRKIKWYKTYVALFLAPLYLYQYLSGEGKAIYAETKRPFHSFKMALAYGAFLLAIGLLLYYDSIVNAFTLPTFGVLGYSFHLLIDRGLKNRIKP